jgi:uncharacterized FlaG/YvyC family protein
MATSNIKPILAAARVVNDTESRAVEAVQAAKRTSSHPVVEDQTTVTGQFSLEGVTAYYTVKSGNIAVFQLVEDATGKVIREVAPEQMMRISSAIDQIMNREREAANSVKGKE